MEVSFSHSGDYVQIWRMSTGREVEVKFENAYTFAPQKGDKGYLYFKGTKALIKRYPDFRDRE